MEQLIEQFGGRCHEILKQGHGPDELEQVRRDLERMLANEDFLAAHLGPGADEARKIIYQDPELEFCILAHVFSGANQSPPHDHGPTWAIYGQAEGSTEMTEYRVVEPYEGGEPGKVEAAKTYRLDPGMAVAYEAGAIHAPKREGETRLIRIEGKNVTTLTRTPYELI
jgi:predicted metal-dependent enzyme (double-stranded beta helix superfamily)